MIDFVRGAFRNYFSAILWIILIGCIVTGLIIGMDVVNERDAALGAFAGLGIGTVVGLAIVILWGGITATFLHMDETLKTLFKMDNKLQSMKGELSFLAAVAERQQEDKVTDDDEYFEVEPNHG